MCTDSWRGYGKGAGPGQGEGRAGLGGSGGVCGEAWFLRRGVRFFHSRGHEADVTR